MPLTDDAGPNSGTPTRAMTSAEWQAWVGRWRRQRPWLVALMVVPIALGAGFVQSARSTPADSLAGRLPVLLGLAFAVVLAVIIGAAIVYRPPERPKGVVRRVGTLRGVFNVRGKPAFNTIGGVRVNIPSEWLPSFAIMEPADVEIFPPLEEDPRESRARFVVSAFSGRLRLGDPPRPS